MYLHAEMLIFQVTQIFSFWSEQMRPVLYTPNHNLIIESI